MDAKCAILLALSDTGDNIVMIDGSFPKFKNSRFIWHCGNQAVVACDFLINAQSGLVCMSLYVYFCDANYVHTHHHNYLRNDYFMFGFILNCGEDNTGWRMRQLQ